MATGGDPDGSALLDFLADMRELRRSCPWKRAQTHRSLARYLQEEAYETLEALDTGDADHLREELGDLLLQVYFHAVIAEETGDFTLDDVARGISDKMHQRNPHVFAPDGSPRSAAGGSSLTPDQVNEQWQGIKQATKPRETPYDGIPVDLPALLLATKLLERVPEAAPPPSSEPADDLGDRLLALVAEATRDGVDAEQALRDAVRRAVG